MFKAEPYTPDHTSTDTFTSPGYDPSTPHEHEHIRDWVSFTDKLDADQLKLLMRFGTIGG
jgi:hypothetical protein